MLYVFRHRSRTLVKLLVKLGSGQLYHWTCRKLSLVFSSATFNSKIVSDFGWRFQNWK